MTDSIDDGGRAFPASMESRPQGVTLRQWYAGQALHNGDLWRAYRADPQDYTSRLLQLADALIAHEKAERDGV